MKLFNIWIILIPTIIVAIPTMMYAKHAVDAYTFKQNNVLREECETAWNGYNVKFRSGICYVDLSKDGTYVPVD